MVPLEYTFLCVWVIPDVGVLMMVNNREHSTKTLVSYLVREPVVIRKKRQLEEA